MIKKTKAAKSEKVKSVKSEKVKKKKKSTALTVTSNEVVLHHPSGEVITDKEFHSILDSSANEIYQLLEVNQTDSATQLLYKRVIQSAYQMLSKIEQSTTETDTKKAYPFNALASTLRDYLVDLQSSLDRAALAESIIDNIFRPMFRDMASQLVIEMGIIGKEAKLLMDDHTFADYNQNVLRPGQDRVIQCMERCYHTAVAEAKKALG